MESSASSSSHIESTVKLISPRIKGSKNFWRADYGDHVLELRADSLCDSQPLTASRTRWRAKQTGATATEKPPLDSISGNAPVRVRL